MPIVTIDPNASERYELKTAPADPNDPNDEDGFIILRPLPYGMKLTRRDKATRMMMRSQPARKGKQPGDAISEIELESYNEWAVAFDFANCILDHNLTDQNKRKIDFGRPMSIKLLNPKVGSEIEKLINDLNEDEDEVMLDDFPPQLNSLSQEEENQSSENGSDTSETQKVTLKEI
jgi:hypothetical protein